MWQSVRQSVFAILGIVSAIIGIWFFYASAWGITSNDGKIAVLILGLLFLWYFLENRFIQFRTTRDARYAAVVPILSAGFSEVHEYTRSSHDLGKAAVALEHLCSAVSQAMTLITGTNCSVSVKVLVNDTYNGGPRIRAHTFCRSSRQGRDTATFPVLHWVDENSDFRYIVEKIDNEKECYFFGNNLPWRYDYRNTSFEIYGSPSHNMFMRYWRWKLPYRSTIVVPIAPSTHSVRGNLLGFLCVDSARSMAFRYSHDVALMQGVADAVYNVLSPLPEADRVTEGRELVARNVDSSLG